MAASRRLAVGLEGARASREDARPRIPNNPAGAPQPPAAPDPSATAMLMPDLCTDDEIAALVNAFYARVRADAVLGPVFAAHVDHWPSHLARLTDFWSSVLRGTARYQGQPMQKHLALPDLSAELFGRWLDLFHASTVELPNQGLRRAADTAAERIARSLWAGWQSAHRPAAAPEHLPRARASGG